MFVVHRFFVSLFLIVFFTQAYALSIVRMEMQLGADITNVDVELYDNVAPLNVANFLGYVQNGDYDNSFFHRKVDDFILQGGFLSYVPVVDVDARFVNFLSGTCLLDFPDPITGELGLRPFGEEYYVDSDGDDKPDFLSPLAVNTPEATADPCDGLNFNAPFLHPTFPN